MLGKRCSVFVQLLRLKNQYDKAAKNIEVARKIDRSDSVIDEKEAQKRIEILEQQLVGGEQANNEALKQKRLKKIKEAERKMQKLAGKSLAS